MIGCFLSCFVATLLKYFYKGREIENKSRASMSFDSKKEVCASVEKRNAIGLWVKKVVVFKDFHLSLADSEEKKSTPSVRFLPTTISRPDESNCVVFGGKNEELQVRFLDSKSAEAFVGSVQAAMSAAANKQKAKSLPVIDPRNGLKFVDVPAEFASKFANLEKSVLYWFANVKKFGTPSTFTRKMTIEERVGFCSDKAFYMTKQNSEITRCIKIGKIEKLSTNVDVTGNPNDEFFVNIHMNSPDYDLCFSSPQLESLLHCFEAVFAQIHCGKKLPVARVKSLSDVDLKLERPSNFSQTMVVPTSKEQLRKALEEFEKKNGIKFTKTGSAEARRSETASVTSQQAPPPEEPSQSDPLGCFLNAVGCGKYFIPLYKQNVDFDILECMDETDLRTYGISSNQDIQAILKGIQDESLMSSVRTTVSQARSGWAKMTPADPRPAAGAVPTSQAPGETLQQKSSEINLDSDDDVLEVKPQFQVVLDSDDDLDLPPPHQKIAVILDDDDI